MMTIRWYKPGYELYETVPTTTRMCDLVSQCLALGLRCEVLQVLP